MAVNKWLVPVFPLTGRSSYPEGVTSVAGNVTLDDVDYFVVMVTDSFDATDAMLYSDYELMCAKECVVTDIKAEARLRIVGLDWKIQRAEERISLGVGEEAELLAVYQEREDIRTASDIAEAELLALTTVKEVKAFSW